MVVTFQEDGALELVMGIREALGRARISQMEEALKAGALGRP